MRFETAENERIRVTADGDVGIGTITPTGSHAVTASNEAVLAVGVVTAREYYGDGSNLSGITGTTINNNANNRLITGSGTANTLEGEANLTFDGSQFAVVSGGATVGGGLTVAGIGIFKDDVQFHGANGVTTAFFDKSANALNFVDGAKAQFGTDNDLEIYHDGSNSYIKETAGTGNLRIEANDLRLKNGDGSEDYIKCNQNAAVELFHNGTKKFETGSDGVIATGIITATGGFDLGIHSAGTSVVSGPVKILNFVGSGNTFAYNAGTDTIDISIAGGSGGGGSGVTETDTTVSTVNPTGVGSFATASFRSASVIAQINQLNTDFQVGRYLMIHDGTTVTVVEESAVSTGSTMLGSFTGVIDGSNVELRVTLASAGVSTVTTKIDTVTV
jgi:hydrogenase maturation factor